MNRKKESLLSGLLILMLALAFLAPLIINGWFARPSADDYDYAMLTHAAWVSGGGLTGVLAAACRTVASFYTRWQGTYTSAFLMSLQPGIFGEKFYRLTPVIVTALMLLCFWGSIAQLNRRLLGRSRLFPVVASLAALALIDCHLPSPNEGLFWYNGAMHYLPPMAAGILVTVSSWEAGLRLSEKHGGRLRLALCCLLALLISGTSYVAVLFQLMLLAALTLWQWLRTRRPYALPVLVFAVIGFVISAMAPGTALRQSSFEQLGLIGSMLTTVRLTLESMSYLFSFQWLLTMAAAVPLAMSVARALPEDQLPRRFPWLILLYSAAIYCGLVCVLVYSTGFTESIWPGRVRDAFHLGFITLTWFDLFIVTAWLRGRGLLPAEEARPAVRCAVTACAFLLMLLPGLRQLNDGLIHANPVQVFVDYHYARPVNYVIQMDQRFDAFHDPAQTEVAVEPLRVTETMVFFSDMTEEYEPIFSEWYGKHIYLTEAKETDDPLDPFHLGE